MATFRTVSGGRTLMGRLRHGADLLEELTAVCAGEGITLGSVQALGAVQKARVGYYDQAAHEYRYLEFNRHMEITALVGNVSLRDGKPMIHAHVTLSDDAGKACGGHLAPGTTIFACEFIIQSLEGERFEREPEPETGLPLWKM